MRTLAVIFKQLAKDLVPEQDDLQDLSDKIDNPEIIDEIMLGKGEYLGGMTTVLLELALKERSV